MQDLQQVILELQIRLHLNSEEEHQKQEELHTTAHSRRPFVPLSVYSRRTKYAGYLSLLLQVNMRLQPKLIHINVPQKGKLFNELVVSDTSKGLCHVFFSQRATSKVPNITDIGLKPRVVKKVTLIGGGLMGSRITTTLIISNIFVVLKEVNSDYLLKGMKTVAEHTRIGEGCLDPVYKVAEPLRAVVMGACKLDNCTTLVMDEAAGSSYGNYFRVTTFGESGGGGEYELASVFSNTQRKADCQKKKVVADYNWAVKNKKTEKRISACVKKIKDTEYTAHAVLWGIEIDLAFLDSLPEELHVEVLSGRQGSVTQPSNSEPQNGRKIDPQFLVPLSPHIWAEVLAQQHANVYRRAFNYWWEPKGGEL
ncbi:crotonase [Artemisia annua]|uniref:Crotonase n=1 Tax=Artemisia annua TaxID=35608 RepID=A0A2U1MCI5_ARTAN|nr:crotonase [Artemisia annua]